MNQPPVNPYLRTKILTASPQELRMLLYDGALRFCRQGRAAIEAGKFDESYHNITRAQKVVTELSTSLRHSEDPALCEKLSALYTYIYRRLIDANMNRDAAALDEAMGLIEYERETWQMLMQKLADEGGDPRAAQRPRPLAAPAASTPYGAYSRSA